MCFAGSDLPSFTIFHQPPELSDHSEKPVTKTESDQPDIPELTFPQPEELSAGYTAAPRQELPDIDEVTLSTSDTPDSDDSFFVQPPSHILAVVKKN